MLLYNPANPRHAHDNSTIVATSDALVLRGAEGLAACLCVLRVPYEYRYRTSGDTTALMRVSHPLSPESLHSLPIQSLPKDELHRLLHQRALWLHARVTQERVTHYLPCVSAHTELGA